MIDWWNLQPRWLKRLRLFLGIVWRMHEGTRMTLALSWDVAKCLHPIATARTILPARNTEAAIEPCTCIGAVAKEEK